MTLSHQKNPKKLETHGDSPQPSQVMNEQVNAKRTRT